MGALSAIDPTIRQFLVFSPQPPRAGRQPERLPISVIEVADEGPGLEPVDAELVFERFYRADRTRSRRHGGSGLGLAIAATIAEGHGGRLELDTAPGRGCTFRLAPARSRLRPGTALIAPAGARPSRRRPARLPAPCYGEVGRWGERSTSRVISLGAKTRNGGPQKPVPRLV